MAQTPFGSEDATGPYRVLRPATGAQLAATTYADGAKDALLRFLQDDRPGARVVITRPDHPAPVPPSTLLDAVAPPGEDLAAALGAWLDRHLADDPYAGSPTWHRAALAWARTFGRPAEEEAILASREADWAEWTHNDRAAFTTTTGWLAQLLEARDTRPLYHSAGQWIDEARLLDEFRKLMRPPAQAGQDQRAAADPDTADPAMASASWSPDADITSALGIVSDLADWCTDQAVVREERAMELLGLLHPDLTDIEDDLARARLPRSGALPLADRHRATLAARARRTARTYVRSLYGGSAEGAEALYETVTSRLAAISHWAVRDDPYAHAWIADDPAMQRSLLEVSVAYTRALASGEAPDSHVPDASGLGQMRAGVAVTYHGARLRHLYFLSAALGRLDAPQHREVPPISAEQAREQAGLLLEALFDQDGQDFLAGRIAFLRSPSPGRPRPPAIREAELLRLRRVRSALTSEQPEPDGATRAIHRALAVVRTADRPRIGPVLGAGVVFTVSGPHLQVRLERIPEEGELTWTARTRTATGQPATFLVGSTDDGLVRTMVIDGHDAAAREPGPRSILLGDGTRVNLDGSRTPDLSEVGRVFPELRLLAVSVRPVSGQSGPDAVTADLGARVLQQFAPGWKLDVFAPGGPALRWAAQERTVVVAGSPEVSAYVAERLRDSHTTPDTAAAHLQMAVAAATDLRLVGVEQPSPGKLDSVVDEVAQLWARSTAPGATWLGPQVVIVQAGRSSSTINAHHYLHEQLALRGVPEDRVAMWPGPPPQAGHPDLMTRVRTGRIDILIAARSDVVGTLQGACTAVHDVDAPAIPVTPREAQRLAGMPAPGGVVIRYTTEGSLDAGLRARMDSTARPAPLPGAGVRRPRTAPVVPLVPRRAAPRQLPPGPSPQPPTTPGISR